jgi:hypothetical protein
MPVSPVSAMVTMRSRGNEVSATRSEAGSTRTTIIVSVFTLPWPARVSTATTRKFSGSPGGADAVSTLTRWMLSSFTRA